MLRDYPLTTELLAWHEAGHAAVMECLGEEWVNANIDPETLSGVVRKSTAQDSSAKPFDAATAPRSIIGTSTALKSQSRRQAIPFYAGIAAELVHLGIPFTPEPFADSNFPDFAAARWLLSLTDSESDSLYCARMAYDLVQANQSRVACLASRLLEDGVILSTEEN